MAYCTIPNLLTWIEEESLVEMVSVSPEATISDSEVVTILNGAITPAGTQIDGYLIGRFGSQLRTGTAPPLVVQFCAQLAVYYLYMRKRAVDEDWQTLYDQIIRELRDLRNGKGDLLASETTGAEIEEPEASYQHDGEIEEDDDLPTNDQRKYTPGKQKKLFGV